MKKISLLFGFVLLAFAFATLVEGQNTYGTLNFDALKPVPGAISSQKLVFKLGRELYVMNADGTDAKQVSAGAAGLNFAVTPDGEKYAFSTNVEIFTFDFSGKGVKIHAFKSTATSLAWSPDGKYIAYVDWGVSLAIVNADGTNKRVLATSAGDLAFWGSSIDNPVFSPDGTKITFNEIGGVAMGHIYVINIDGTGLEQLTSFDVRANTIDGKRPEANVSPSWSPNGKQIAYGNYFNDYDGLGSGASVRVMDADGKNMRVLLNEKNGVGYPMKVAWSLDGSEIAFIDPSYDGGAIAFVSPDGTNARTIFRGDLNPYLYWIDANFVPREPEPTAIFEESWGTIKHYFLRK